MRPNELEFRPENDHAVKHSVQKNPGFVSCAAAVMCPKN
jgi:hypothetical protein